MLTGSLIQSKQSMARFFRSRNNAAQKNAYDQWNSKNGCLRETDKRFENEQTQDSNSQYYPFLVCHGAGFLKGAQRRSARPLGMLPAARG